MSHVFVDRLCVAVRATLIEQIEPTTLEFRIGTEGYVGEDKLLKFPLPTQIIDVAGTTADGAKTVVSVFTLDPRPRHAWFAVRLTQYRLKDPAAQVAAAYQEAGIDAAPVRPSVLAVGLRGMEKILRLGALV